MDKTFSVYRVHILESASRELEQLDKSIARQIERSARARAFRKRRGG